MTVPVRATGLTKRFSRRRGDVVALDDVDLDVVAGATTVVAGPSLAGKTTLLDVLAGWAAPDRGAVAWFGEGTPPPWSRLAVVPQSFALLEELTVEENVLFAGRAGTIVVDEAHAAAVLDRLGLTTLRRRLAGEVSVGERQRVMVARAVVGRPAVLLADDPASHQDEHHAALVLELIAERAAGGGACLVATRADAVPSGFGDRFLRLDHGRIEATEYRRRPHGR